MNAKLRGKCSLPYNFGTSFLSDIGLVTGAGTAILRLEYIGPDQELVIVSCGVRGVEYVTQNAVKLRN